MKEIKIDCFAFRSDAKGIYCNILKSDMWDCKGCRFYKTEQEYKEKCANLRHKG